MQQHSPRSLLRGFSRLWVLVFACSLAFGSGLEARPQGLVDPIAEGYALAKDRDGFLETLLPGSVDRRYYTCLRLLELGRVGEARAELERWPADREDSRRPAIEARVALLGFEQEPERTWRYLEQRYPPVAGSSRGVRGLPGNGASRLDPKSIERSAFERAEFESYSGSYSNWSQAALERVDPARLSRSALRSWLLGLERPDVPGLVEALLRAEGFGDRVALLDCAKRLLLEVQFSELAERLPALLGDRDFVNAWIQRLRPPEGIALEVLGSARQAYLERLEALCRRLPPVQDSLVAHVLYHRLDDDHRQGRLDLDRLLRYLALAPQRERAPVKLGEALDARGSQVDLGQRFETGLPQISDDEPLVHELLLEVLAKREDGRVFSGLIEEDALTRTLAEAQLLAGDPDVERWRGLLGDDAAFDRFEQRRELRFAARVPQRFELDQPIELVLDLKRIDSLLIQVYPLDAAAHYRATGKPLTMDLDLEGFLPAQARSESFQVSPLVRQERSFRFDSLAGPGAALIRFVGGGQELRALVIRGQLELETRPGPMGLDCRIFDETGSPRPGARLWLGAREFIADSLGALTLPFAEERSQSSVVLVDGPRAGLAGIQLLTEQYQLRLAAHVELESLLSGAQAQVLLRPRLEVNGVPIPLARLSAPVVELTATRRGSVQSRRRYTDLQLADDAELPLEFTVPENLSRLRFRIEGDVLPLQGGAPRHLSGEVAAIDLANIQDTQAIRMPLFGRDAEGYFIDLLGRAGEPAPGVSLSITCSHRDFAAPITVELFTDNAGRVRLETLPDIAAVMVRSPDLKAARFELAGKAPPWPEAVNLLKSQSLDLPIPRDLPAQARVSLLEKRGAVLSKDLSALVQRVPGALRIEGLPAGDFDLWIPSSDQRCLLRVAPDSLEGADRRLLPSASPTLSIAQASADLDFVDIQLVGVVPGTRVHIGSSRFAAIDDWGDLASIWGEAEAQEFKRLGNRWEDSRRLSDEARYILARRLAEHFPGSLLERPGLLLAPYTAQVAEGGSSFSNDRVGVGGGSAGGPSSRRGGRAQARGSRGPDFGPGLAELSFLAEPSKLLSNLRPDADGRLRVPRRALAGGGWLRILALGPTGSATAELGIESTPLPLRERRLSAPMPGPEPRFERRRVDFLAQWDLAVMPAVDHAAFATLGSLGDVLTLLGASSGLGEVETFRFLTRWPEIETAERLELYDRYTSHEVDFFLYQKDRPFFEAVVRPYLSNKGQRDFLDEWLLEQDLSRYLEPARFAALNTIERVLLLTRSDLDRGRIEVYLRDQDQTDWRQASEQARLLRQGFEAGLVGGALGGQGAAGGFGRALNTVKMDRQAPGAGDGFFLGAGDSVPPAEELLGSDSDEAEERDNEDKSTADRKLKVRPDRSRAYYRAPGETQALTESYWWQRPLALGSPQVLGLGFWREYALSDPAADFAPEAVLGAVGGLSEILMALAVLDLPFEAEAPSIERSAQGVTLEARTPLLVLRRELGIAESNAGVSLLVASDLIEGADRDQSRARPALDPQALEAGRRYALRCVITNPGPESIEAEALLQLPVGALALDGREATRSQSVRLEPWGTELLLVPFYFPSAGEFTHRPGHVLVGDRAVASLADRSVRVYPSGGRPDSGSFADLVAHGTADQLFAFLRSADLPQLDLSRLAPRLFERPLFLVITTALRERLYFDFDLWRFSILHRDARTAGEFLGSDPTLRGLCAPLIESALLFLEPFVDLGLEHLDLAPLIRPRAHVLEGSSPIEIPIQAENYAELLSILAHRPTPRASDRLALCVHLLYQDRTREALGAFASLDPSQLVEHLQYDYLAATLALATLDFEGARRWAAPHREHPIPRWRRRFGELLAVLDAAQGVAPLAGDPEDPRSSAQNTVLAALEPTLELLPSGEGFELSWTHLEAAELCFFPIDVEFQFSRAPFAQSRDGSSGPLEPLLRVPVELDPRGGRLPVSMPEALFGQPTLVEARAGALVRRQLWQPSGLAVELVENYGRLSVRERASGKPLVATYVKVFTRDAQGVVRFHKDGYTDVLGRFDYLSVTPPTVSEPRRFAILVLQDGLGAAIREVGPPPR